MILQYLYQHITQALRDWLDPPQRVGELRVTVAPAVIVLLADLSGLKHDSGLMPGAEHFTGLLEETFRDTDIAARIGGDEFAVIVVDITKDMKEVVRDKINNINNELPVLLRNPQRARRSGTLYHNGRPVGRIAKPKGEPGDLRSREKSGTEQRQR